MPEGPEVRTLVQQLKRHIENELLFGAETEFFVSAKKREAKWTSEYSFPTGYFYVRELNCHGKLIYWKIENDLGEEKYYLCHLAMTGGLTTEPRKDAMWQIQNEKENFFFYDARKFGKFVLVSRADLLKELKGLGPDILVAPPSESEFLARFQKSRKNICALLMDQSVLSGVGNYIKNEALYAAKINPWAAGKDIPKHNLLVLRQELLRISQTSLALQGATLSTFRNIDDKPGEFQNLLLVYKKKIDPLGNKIEEIKTPDQRTTHWVKEIQTIGIS